MASLRLTSNERTASRAPTYRVEPSSLSNSVVVLWTSGRLKWTRDLSAESAHKHHIKQVKNTKSEHSDFKALVPLVKLI